jgi:hypothetical protein
MEAKAVEKSKPARKRWVTTRNPWTQEKERFQTAISDEAFRAWEAQRNKQLREFYPDRPPDKADDLLTCQRWDLTSEEPFQDHTDSIRGSGLAVTIHDTWQSTPGVALVKHTFGKREDAWFVYRVVRNIYGVLVHDILRLSDVIVGEEDIEQRCRELHVSFNRGPKGSVTVKEIEASLP